jgi:MarR family transcriptional regulator, organic hydroperoxide resistance regulator
VAESGDTGPGARRRETERRVAAAIRALGAMSDRLGRIFARTNGVTNNELLALQHVIVSEHAGRPLSSGELGRRLDLSSSATTYLVDHLIAAGHVRRDADSADRRRVILRYSEHGRSVAEAFFGPLGVHTHAALRALPDTDLDAAERVLKAVHQAMVVYHDELTTPEKR